MTASQSLKVYEVLQRHFKNNEDAKIVVTEIEGIIESKIDSKEDIFLTKDDKVDLIDRINRSKVETIIWIVSVGLMQFVLSFLIRK